MDTKINGLTKIKNKLLQDTNISILLFIFIITVITLGGILGNRFFSVGNMQSMGYQISEFGFLAIAMSLAMITGGIDLSIVANAGLSGIIAALTMSGAFFPIEGMSEMTVIVISIISAVTCSTLCGLLNGFLIGKISIPPILATLGTMILYTGIGMAITNGESVRVGISSFSKLGSKTFMEIPYIFLLMVLAFIVVGFILEKTKFGREIYMVGENKVALEFSGVNAEKVIMKTYALIGFLVGISAIIIVSRVNSARMGFGDTYQLQAILVAVLGGIDPDGGKGKIMGVALSIVVIQFLQSAFTILQFTPYAKKLIWGILLLLVMTINYLINEKKIFNLKK